MGAQQDAWLAGFAVALAEMHRQLVNAGHDAALCRVARDAGLTLAEARRVGVSQSDLDRLAKAGVT